MTPGTASKHSRRKVRNLVVATVLLLSLGMGLSGRWLRRDGHVSITLLAVVQGFEDYEAKILLRNDSARSVRCSKVQVDHDMNVLYGPFKVELKPGAEVVYFVPIPTELLESRVGAYVTVFYAPTLKERVMKLLPAWAKPWDEFVTYPLLLYSEEGFVPVEEFAKARARADAAESNEDSP